MLRTPVANRNVSPTPGDTPEPRFLTTASPEARSNPHATGRAAPVRNKIGDSGGIELDDPVKMNTRSKQQGDSAPKPSESLSPEELDIVRANLSAQEKRLREQADALHAEHEKIKREREAWQKEREETSRQKEFSLIKEREYEVRDPSHSVDELAKELANLRREMERIKTRENAPARTTEHYIEHVIPENDHARTDIALTPKISFREATEMVPMFNGYNIPLSQFAQSCRRARDLVPPSCEPTLTKLLINKLRGRAYSAVEGEVCETITQLIDELNRSFGAQKPIDQLRGDLCTIHLRRGEHVLDYISRVRELREAILDAERRSRGFLDYRATAEIDDSTLRAFLEGLPSGYRLYMRFENYVSLPEAFADAKDAAGKQEKEEKRLGPGTQARIAARPSYPNPSEPPPRYRTAGFARDYDSRPRYNDDVRQDGYARGSDTRHSDSPRRYAERPPNTFADRNRNNKWCRYCKNAGHEIEECRKREYNNSRNQQGNREGPSSRQDATRGETTHTQSRPIRAIETIPAEPPANESQP